MAEAKKRVRHPAIKRDGLIDAVIRKLPAEGAIWPVEQRQAWLRMAVQAFDVAYGVQPGIHIGLEPVVEKVARENPMPTIEGPAGGGMSDSSNVTRLRRPTAAEIAELDEPRYFIDAQGFARGPGGVRVKATDVPGDTIIEDERQGEKDLDSIIWADGTWPGAALPPLNFAAA